MASSIKFDGTELVGATYIPEYVRHESMPGREIVALDRMGDGASFVSSRWAQKRIAIRGTLTGASEAALEASIDTLKELLGREQKTLAISFASGTRNYVATCESFEVAREFYQVNHVPYLAVFAVLTGEGRDTSATLALDEHAVTVTTPGTDTFTLAGSKPPEPVITLEGSYFNPSHKGIEYRNTDTGERLIFTKKASWQTNASVVIDCENRKVTSDVARSTQVEGDFYGVFPKFKIGANGVRITVGDIVNQTSPDAVAGDTGNSLNLNATTKYKAQSFRVPYRDETFQGLTLLIAKVGTPGDLTIRVETDADGEPSGNYADAVNTSEAVIAAASVGASAAYVTGYAAAPYILSANTPYWLVISAAGVDAGNYYEISYLDANALVGSYLRGKAAYSDDSGSTWADDANALTICFRVLFGGKAAAGAVKHSVSYRKTYL
ncbi:MAG: hypothetical protein M0R37_13640 [Bacteroidales bacterium]|nr:hypothetical protein [Bacteroidales bacterium]